MSRIFEHFPKQIKCPICDTNKDKPAVLIPISGTQEGNNIQAITVHHDCIIECLSYDKASDIFIGAGFTHEK